MSVENFGERDAALIYRAPVPSDDKYSRGVLGFATGSLAYPGAALLGVDGALSTGIGLVRYVGPPVVTGPLMSRRPEVVLGTGRVDAWVIGSGMDDADAEALDRARSALEWGIPAVVDAGAMSLLPVPGHVVATPHAGEVARDLEVSRAAVEANPAEYALLAASKWNSTVVLKGSTTFIANPLGDEYSVSLATPWLAVAGAGDVLAGVIGAIVASRRAEIEVDPHFLARVAATGVVIHSLAARRASGGGPFLLERLVDTIPTVIRGLLAE